MTDTPEQDQAIATVVLGVGQDTNCLDRSVFDTERDLTPDLLYQRPQFTELTRYIAEFLKLNSRRHVLIVGPRGCGKTAIVRYILKNMAMLEFPFKSTHINCRDYSNSYQVMRRIIGEHRRITRTHALESFMKAVELQNTKHILVLDEADLLRDDNLLYDISRHPELSNILLVLITKTPKFYTRLTEDVKSSLVLQKLYWDTYSSMQIHDILLKRCQKGLKKYDELVLGCIALANENYAHSDIRAGLNVLYDYFERTDFFGSTADANGQPHLWQGIVEDINEAMRSEYMRMRADVIRSLNDNKLLVLKFTLDTGMAAAAFGKYKTMTERPMSRMLFWWTLEELTYLDLLAPEPVRLYGNNVTRYKAHLEPENIALVNQLLLDRGYVLNGKSNGRATAGASV